MVKNLEYIARSAMFYLRKSSDQDYAYFLQQAKRCYTEILPHNGLRRLGVYYGKLDQLNRLGLPEDFVMYTRVGVLAGNRVWTLTIDPALALIDIPDCLENLDESDGVDSGTQSGAMYGLPNAYGLNYTPFAGGGAFNFGYYRPDLPNHQIQFSSSLRDFIVVLEYISNGGEVTGSTRVMEAYVDCLIKYCIWQDIEHDMTIPMNERDRRKADYMYALADANFDAGAPLIQEVLDAIYQSSGDKFR